MKRLLLFNLATDADDPTLGFTTTWINALAVHYDALDVITMRAGRLAVAPNVCVYSVGKEKGYSEPRRALEFYRLLIGLLRQHHYAACFAHMMPLFALMGAPLLKLARVPITLWYVHKSVTRLLWLAEKSVDHVVTASAESFRLPSRKVIVTGHGIDTELFHPDRVSPHEGFTIISVGRIAPVKRLDVMLEAVRILVQEHGLRNVRLRLVGETDSPTAAALRQTALEQGLADVLELRAGVPYLQVPALYHTADVYVNMSETGSLDKALLEAMACGLPVVTGNDAGRSLLSTWSDRLTVPMGNARALAEKLAAQYHLSPDERHALGLELRQIVIEHHSLAALATRLSKGNFA